MTAMGRVKRENALIHRRSFERPPKRQSAPPTPECLSLRFQTETLLKRGRYIDPHRLDAGKKIKGKKWHILVDTQASDGSPAICIETRQANAAMKTMPNKTDRNDARALAQIMRTGWFRQVHVKSRQCRLWCKIACNNDP